MTRFAGKLAISSIFAGKLAIPSIFDGFVACLAAPQVLWVPESLPPDGSLWQPVATDWMPQKKSSETSRPGGLRLRCPDAAVAGWLARVAG